MRILLAIDGSEQSYDVARALQHLTSPEDLIVLHAIDVPSQAYPTMMPEVALELYQRTERRMREEGERVLDTVISLLPQVGRVSKRLEIGSPAGTILSMAEQERIDLIVMGARGLGKVQELIMGSVSHRVLMTALCSVLLIKAPLRHIRHILLPVSGSEDAEVAIGFLSRKPFKDAPEVKVLSVLHQPSWPIEEPLKERALQSTKDFAQNVALQLSGVYRMDSTVALGDPATAILQRGLRPPGRI